MDQENKSSLQVGLPRNVYKVGQTLFHSLYLKKHAYVIDTKPGFPKSKTYISFKQSDGLDALMYTNITVTHMLMVITLLSFLIML